MFNITYTAFEINVFALTDEWVFDSNSTGNVTEVMTERDQLVEGEMYHKLREVGTAILLYIL